MYRIIHILCVAARKRDVFCYLWCYGCAKNVTNSPHRRAARRMRSKKMHWRQDVGETLIFMTAQGRLKLVDGLVGLF